MMFRKLFVPTALCAAAALSAYEVEGPRVYPADTEQTIRIVAENDAEKKHLAENELWYLAQNAAWTDGDNHRGNRPLWQQLPSTFDGAGRTVKVMLRGEQMHHIRLGSRLQKSDPKPKKNRRALFRDGEVDFGFYTVKEDLRLLLPWKGTIHQHSTRCGHASVEPAMIPLYCRRAGFDYMSLSEHKLHAPGIEAMESNKQLDCGMTAFPAEEFHTKPAILHSLAIGHRAGVNAWIDAHPKEFEERWQAEMKKKEYDAYGFSPFERKITAQARIFYQVAREQGAKILVLCHPTDHNVFEHYDDHPARYRQAVLDLFDYDALELLNAAQRGNESRISLMNALATEQIEKGRKFACVSVSDCHNHDKPNTLLAKYYTVIFAPGCELDDFAAAIRDRRAVAARSIYPSKLRNLYFGPSRLMNYQIFLEQEYWPKHDELCKNQGEFLFKWRQGDASARAEIDRLKAEIRRYREKFFGLRPADNQR